MTLGGGGLEFLEEGWVVAAAVGFLAGEGVLYCCLGAGGGGEVLEEAVAEVGAEGLRAGLGAEGVVLVEGGDEGVVATDEEVEELFVLRVGDLEKLATGDGEDEGEREMEDDVATLAGLSVESFDLIEVNLARLGGVDRLQSGVGSVLEIVESDEMDAEVFIVGDGSVVEGFEDVGEVVGLGSGAVVGRIGGQGWAEINVLSLGAVEGLGSDVGDRQALEDGESMKVDSAVDGGRGALVFLAEVTAFDAASIVLVNATIVGGV